MVMLYLMKSKNNGIPVPRNDNFNALAFTEILFFSVHLRQHGQRIFAKSVISSSLTFFPTIHAFFLNFNHLLNASMQFQS